MAVETDFKISEPTRIVRLFQSLCLENYQVSLEFANSRASVDGNVVHVDSENMCFTVEIFFSTETIARPDRGSVFNMESVINGIKLSAKLLKIAEIQDGINGQCYVVPLPKMITYYQRREVFRAQVSTHRNISVDIFAANTFESGDERSVPPLATGKLTNISYDGCEVLVPDSQIHVLDTYRLLTVLEFHHSEEETFPPIFAFIRHTRSVKRKKIGFVGFEVSENSPTVRRSYGFFVTCVQLMERDRDILSA